MRLSCPSCASALDASDADLRRRLVACTNCGAHFRLGADGLVPSSEVARSERPPDGMKVRELPGGGLEIFARAGGGGPVLGARDLPALAVLLAGAVGISSVATADLGIMVAIFAGVAYLVVRPRLFTKMETIRLSGGRLKPAHYGNALSVSAIRQLYTAAPQTAFFGQEQATLVGLWALRRDGGRAFVAGPFRTVDEALHVEGLLELRLGLFDQEVHGQSSRPEDHAAPLDAPPQAVEEAPLPKGPVGCGSCGARLEVDEATMRRGVVDCGYCTTRTLLVDLDTKKPLGGFDEDAAWTTVLVVRSAATLRVAWRANGRIALEVEDGVLAWPLGRWGFDRIHHVIPDFDSLPKPSNALDIAMRVAQRQAGSGTVDWMDADHLYPAHQLVELLVVPKEGKPRKLLDGPLTAWEAGTLQRELRRRMGGVT